VAFDEAGTTPVGINTECRWGNCFAAYQSRLFDESGGTSPPNWTYFLFYANTRSVANRLYAVDAAGGVHIGSPTNEVVESVNGSSGVLSWLNTGSAAPLATLDQSGTYTASNLVKAGAGFFEVGMTFTVAQLNTETSLPNGTIASCSNCAHGAPSLAMLYAGVWVTGAGVAISAT